VSEGTTILWGRYSAHFGGFECVPKMQTLRSCKGAVRCGGGVRARSGGNQQHGHCGHTLFQRLSTPSCDRRGDLYKWQFIVGGLSCHQGMAGMAAWLVALSMLPPVGIWVQSFMTAMGLHHGLPVPLVQNAKTHDHERCHTAICHYLFLYSVN